MEMKLLSLEIKDFKGTEHKVINFYGKVIVINGANGSGKSSIMAAFTWLMCDMDENLISNPPVFPIHREEASPYVCANLEIDGNPVQLSRTLKRTVKNRDSEAPTISFNSTYTVNGIEYGLRDFKAKLEEYGIDLVRLSSLIHPDSFLAEKKDSIRNVLFGMASEFTDKDIVNATDGADTVKELINNYTLEEIENMHKATIRKGKEIYGVNGQLINAKIEALESSRIVVDLSALELAKNCEQEEINNLKAEIAAINCNDDLITAKSKQAEITNKMASLSAEIRKNYDDLKSEKSQAIEFEKLALSGLRDKLTSTNRLRLYAQNKFDEYKANYDELKKLLNDFEKSTFDESKNVCPTCKREYSVDKKAEIKAEWESNKASEIENVKAKMNTVNVSAKDVNKEIKAYKEEIEKLNSEFDAKVDFIAGLTNEYEKLVAPNVSDYCEYKALNSDLTEIISTIANLEAKKANMAVLMANVKIHEEKLEEIKKQLSSVDFNTRLDAQIEELVKQRDEFQQNLANAEKVLYELELVSRKRNELITESINKHFKLVRFSFFEFIKNGSYKECCKCFVENKEVGISTNTALTMLAKLDVISGLQRFYNQFIPVFLDGAEALSGESRNAINIDSQLIMLCVAENKELEVI